MGGDKRLMDIRPTARVASPAPVSRPAAPLLAAAPAVAAAPPARLEGGVANWFKARYTGTMALLARVPGIHGLGLKIFGWMSKPAATDPSLGNRGTVAPTLLRGAQPDEAGFATLAREGVKTVINLREERDVEGPIVEALGMAYKPLLLTPVGAPTLAQGEAFLAAVTDPANGKVFVHCHRGSDRTGALIAIYRIAVAGASVAQALAELPAHGFRVGYEQDKVDFVRAFAAHWAGLSQAERDRVLHR